MDGHYLVDSPRSGPENMAADQCMLELAAATHRPFLRFYQWKQPTLSLGYFQKYGDRQLHAESQAIEVVRRATGGGAIVHHHDWTYAAAIPNGLLEQNDQSVKSVGASQQLYDCVHNAVVDWLRQLGWNALTWDAACRLPLSDTHGCRFLCFERRSRGDIVVGDSKIMGSAQRRIPGAILQHGSLLLDRSPHASSLAGLRDIPQLLAGQNSDQPVPTAWRTEFAYAFHQQIVNALGDLCGQQFHAVSELGKLLPNLDFQAESRFNSPNWTLRVP